jgi:hypothetical protein
VEVNGRTVATVNGAPWPLWAMLPSWRVIHAIRELGESEADPDDYWTSGTGTTVCGHTGFLEYPGVITRLGRQRCGLCCDALGLPRGKGHPVNDEECRALLGYPPSRAHGSAPSTATVTS